MPGKTISVCGCAQFRMNDGDRGSCQITRLGNQRSLGLLSRNDSRDHDCRNDHENHDCESRFHGPDLPALSAAGTLLALRACWVSSISVVGSLVTCRIY